MKMWLADLEVVLSNHLDLISQIREGGFERIADHIELKWDTYIIKDYLNNLILSNREDRQGFPQEVFDAILKLYLLHENIYPKDVKAGAWINAT